MRTYDYDKVFKFIIEYKQANDGLSPTIRKIMSQLDIKSTSTTARILNTLASEGRITRTNQGIKVTGGEWRLWITDKGWMEDE